MSDGVHARDHATFIERAMHSDVSWRFRDSQRVFGDFATYIM